LSADWREANTAVEPTKSVRTPTTIAVGFFSYPFGALDDLPYRFPPLRAHQLTRLGDEVLGCGVLLENETGDAGGDEHQRCQREYRVESQSCGEAKVEVGGILQPSPASPKANRGWAAEIESTLARLGAL
jgi:hypothetical protein